MKELINFLLEAQILARIQKAGLRYLRGPLSESTASHSFLATLAGWVLAYLEKADEPKVIKLCLLHDIAESRMGDQNIMDLFYVKRSEKKIFKEIFKNLPPSFKKELQVLIDEFIAEETPEAIIANDASKLAWMIIVKECLALGNKEAKKWLHFSLARLRSKSAKQMGKSLIEMGLDDWWLEVVQKKLGVSEAKWKSLIRR